MLSYSELIKRSTFLGRFRYAALSANVGDATFGHSRPLNQRFYMSNEWKRARDLVIIRDDGCDLGVPGYQIMGRLLVHHLNPLVPDDILHFNEDRLFNPENLICVSERTHNAIHFGDENGLESPIIERRPGDTRPW